MKKLIINNGKVLADSTGKIFGIESDVTITGKGGWQGTPVPNTGHVENVYFNTALSVDDVVSLLSQLTLNMGGNVEILLMSEDSSINILVQHVDGVWSIADPQNQNFYFYSQSVEDFDFVGWNPNINYPIGVNSNVLSELEGAVLGTQNDKLANLFSITPFIQASGESIGLSGEYDGSPIEVSENGNVDIKALIENKQIPLEVNVNVESENTLKTLLDNTKKCCYLFNEYKVDNINELIKYNDTENVTNFSYMFYYCKATSFPLLNTSKGTEFNMAFTGCSNGKVFPAWNVSNGTEFSGMYTNCSKAISILMYGMQKKFYITQCTSLEAEALVTILSNCQVITTGQIITMGSTLLAKLEGVYVKETGVEQYEGITCRPCVICESTDTGAMLATDYITGKGWTLA